MRNLLLILFMVTSIGVTAQSAGSAMTKGKFEGTVVMYTNYDFSEILMNQQTMLAYLMMIDNKIDSLYSIINKMKNDTASEYRMELVYPIWKEVPDWIPDSINFYSIPMKIDTNATKQD